MIKTAVAMLVLCVMVVSEIPYSLMQAVGVDDIPTEVYAEDGDKTITGLCTGTIDNPTSGAGGWSYVYFGTYGSEAMKFRVLDKASTQFNTNTTMLLDCNSTIVNKRFDDDSNVWANSEIKSWLNGNDFYGSTDVFTTQEKAAIASSTKGSAASGDGNGYSLLGYAPLAGEYVFLLDAVEATRPSYGYANTNSTDVNRSKSGTLWWLRSPYSKNSKNAGLVNPSGFIYYYDVFSVDLCVSPALNLNLESVIFSSEISDGYKLTIKDANMTIAQTGGSDVTRDGNVVTVPYTISGTNSGNATQVSVLIMDSSYSAGTAATSGYSYLKLTVDTWDTSGTGTFTLPAVYADKTCGTDYYAYILAEDVNDGTATDYASVPTPIMIPPPHTHDFTYSAEDATITATCANNDGECPLYDGNGNQTVTLTIAAPERTTYGGSESASATLTGLSDFNAATRLSVAESAIMYEGRDSTTYAANTTAPTAVGTYTARITIAGVTTAEGDGQSVTASIDYEIGKATMTVTADDVSATYDGNEHGITVTVSDPSSDYTVTYGTSAGSCTQDASPGITSVANSPLTVYYKVTADNYEDYTGSATVTITNASQASPDAPTMASNTTTSITLTSVDGLEYSKDGTTWQISNVFTGLTSGTSYTFYQRKKAIANYDASPASAGASFSTLAHTHNYTYAASGAVITATCGNEDEGHTGSLSTTLRITAPALTTYGGSGSASATLAGLSDFNSATGLSIAESSITYAGRGNTTYAVSTTAPTQAGTYTASITVQGETATLDYEIAKRELTITAEDKAKNYGTSDPALTATVAGFAGGDSVTSTNLTYTLTRAAGENGGTYAITPSAATGNADLLRNYTFKYVTGTFTINGMPITITASPQTITYGDTIPGDVSKVSVTSGTILSGDTISAITFTANGTDVTTTGTVTPSAAVIKNASGEDVTSNYDITYAGGNLTINKAPSVYTTDPSAIGGLAYDGMQLTLINAGTTGDGTINYKVEAIAASDEGGTVPSDGFGTAAFSAALPYATKAGTYRVTYYIVGDGNHYDSAESTIDVTIAKGTPVIGTVTADELVNTTDVSTVTLHRSDTTIPGTLSLKDGTTLGYGTNSCNYEFVPADTANYKTAIGTVSVYVKDTVSPSGTISIRENSWSSFLNTITFGLYKRADSVTITGTDTGCGIGSISYYIYESQTGLSEAEVMAIADDSWTAYTAAFNVPHDTKCIIYARITDKQGNKVYISSDGLILDGTPPAITGATNGASYANGTTINISVSDETGLASVTVNGVAKTLTGDTYTQTISGAGTYTITATDTAGNTSTLRFTIKSPGSSDDSENNNPGNTPSSDDGNKPTDNNDPGNNNPGNNNPSDDAKDDKKTDDSRTDNPGNNGRNDNNTDKKPNDTSSADDANAQDDRDNASIDDKNSNSGTPDDGTGVTATVTSGDSERIYFNEERTADYGNGTVIIRVDVEGPDGTTLDYSGSITGDTEAILRAVLTEEEIDAVAQGESAWIRLVVTLIADDVPETDREQIEAALTTIADQELIPGTYYDLRVMKSIGGGEWEYITTLSEDIEITLDIDESLRSDERTFYILRSHDGAVTMLFDKDDDQNTITFSSKYFSTYALVYTDSPDAAKALNDKHNCFMHWIILSLALIGEVCAIIFRRRKDKRKLLIGAEGGDIVLMLVLAILGSCMWDWIVFAIGTVAIAVTIFLNVKKER